MIHIWRPLWGGDWRGGGRVRQKWDVIERRGVGGLGVFWTSNRYFIIKENWIWAMTRHDANNILSTRNLPFDSDVRQCSHPLVTQMHCLWAKSNNRMRGQFECDVTLFLFSFRSFTCTVWLLFYSLFTFSRCANKTGWLQNEYYKC